MLKKMAGLVLALIMVMGVSGVFPAMAAKSDTDITYPVEGGNIYFDPETGTITGCDVTVVRAEIPVRIRGVAVTSIGDWAFKNCSSLISVEMPSVTRIGVMAFYCCGALKSASMPNVTHIEADAFYECGLTSASMPSAMNLGSCAFIGCVSLERVTMPKVTSVSGDAFSYCESLISIDVGSDNTAYSTDDGVLFNKDKTELVIYPAGKTKISPDYTVPESVASIGDWAFVSCSLLESVTMPNVTSVGDNAFYLCSRLERVEMLSVTEVGEGAFSGCSSLKSAKMPRATSIGNDAFSRCGVLLSAEMPSVTSIGYYAFYECGSLESVCLPKSLASIGLNAFDRCAGLKNVYYEGLAAGRAKINIDTGNDTLLKAAWHYKYVFEKSESMEITGDYAGKVEAAVVEGESGVLVKVKAKDAEVDKSAIWCFAVNGSTAAKKLTGEISGDEVTFAAGEKNAKIFLWDDKMRPITNVYER